MSRRAPDPAAQRTAQNQATIKSLLKLEPNKICADCKRNKHPRWASWNLGVFICIRCSGIHRGMGTHISRVKSVDLDSWTDEQLQSILSWGNARANKYWEAKLAQGHVPSEAKIENFIRTKYELKRWVMDGGIPDPSTLDVEGDDDVPLSLVKEKQEIQRKESLRKTSGPAGVTRQPPQAPQADLIGSDPIPRASTAGPQVPAKESAPPKAARSTNDSLLGLDFMGSQPAQPPRPASTSTSASAALAAQSRPDLKQSILSLYATAPRPAPAQQSSHSPSNSFSGLQGAAQPQQAQSNSLNDAFSSLSFGNMQSTTKSPTAPSFPRMGSVSSAKSPATTSTSSAFSGLGAGSFFDAKPAQTVPAQTPQSSFSRSNGFGDFSTASPAIPKSSTAPSASMDLFDFASPAPASTSAMTPSQPSQPSQSSSSVFNLSQPKPEPPKAASQPTQPSFTSNSSSFPATDDPWGGNAWAQPAASQPAVSPAATKSTTNDFGWGSGNTTTQSSSGGGLGGMGNLASTPIVPGASGGFAAAPKVAADEEFGGWASSTGGNNATTSGASGGGGGSGFGGASEDLFSNVWK